MKLFRFGAPGQERPGVLHRSRHLDVSAFGEDYGETFFGSDGMQRLTEWLEREAGSCPSLEPHLDLAAPVEQGAAQQSAAQQGTVRIGPPILRPSKIICVGLNYRQHALETGAELPSEPKLFFKAPSALSGPYDDLELPRGSQHTDWEVELALVIGKRAKYVERDRALEHVAGLAVMNDYSERHFQKERAGQWMKGKSADGFAPLGPYLVPLGDVDYGDLRLWLEVNGERRQDSSTRDMVFDVPTLVSYVSEFMTLCSGDVISTGTPPGVGLGMSPPRFLKPGDRVRYGIEGLGTATQTVLGARP